MQGERVVYQNFTLSPPPPKKKLFYSYRGPIVYYAQGGQVFFYRMWCIKTLTPPPQKKKIIIVTYENCTLPPRQKQFLKCNPPPPVQPLLDLNFRPSLLFPGH